MKLTINRKTLLDALNSVAVALSSGRANPQGNNVLLAVGGNQLSLICDSTQLRAEIEVACQTAELGGALVPHSKLASLLQRPFEDAQLETTEKALILTAPGLTASIPTLDIATFPPVRLVSQQLAMIGFANPDFAKAFAIACQCAGDGKAHAWNEGIAFQDDGSEFRLLSGDGRQFLRLPLPSGEMPFETLLPAKLIRPLAAPIAAEDSVTMFAYAGYSKFLIGSLTVYVQAMDLKYGQLEEACLQKKQALTSYAKVAREPFLQALQSGAAMLESEDFGLRLEINAAKNQIAVNVKSKSTAAFQEAVTATASGALSLRKFNHQLLIPAVKMFDCGELIIQYAESDHAICITPALHKGWDWFTMRMMEVGV